MAEVLRFWRESFAFVADEEGDGMVWGEIRPDALRAWREADEKRAVSGGPAAELAVGGAGELEVEDSAHAGADDGGIEGVAVAGKKDDASDSGGFGGAEDGAEIACGAEVLDHQPAEAVMGVGGFQRAPMLFDDSADAGNSFGNGDGAELFGRDAKRMNAAGDELADHHFDEVVFEQDGADDQEVELETGVKCLNKLADAFDPEML